MLCFFFAYFSLPKQTKYHLLKESFLKSFFLSFLCLFSEFYVFMTPKKKYDYNEFLDNLNINGELVT